MRNCAILTAGVVLFAASVHASAGIVSPAGLSQVNASSIQYVQDKRKSDTLSKRLKRSWKNLVGYTFDVACPIPIPFSHNTCSETGKNREDARAKCTSRYPFCYVTDARR